jgi:hypothetical protein
MDGKEHKSAVGYFLGQNGHGNVSKMKDFLF